MALAYPRLLKQLSQIDSIQPPPLLIPVHKRIKKLLELRSEAYRLTIDGWEEEQRSERPSTLYVAAEERIENANAIALELNGELTKMYEALETASASGP